MSRAFSVCWQTCRTFLLMYRLHTICLKWFPICCSSTAWLKRRSSRTARYGQYKSICLFYCRIFKVSRLMHYWSIDTQRINVFVDGFVAVASASCQRAMVVALSMNKQTGRQQQQRQFLNMWVGAVTARRWTATDCSHAAEDLTLVVWVAALVLVFLVDRMVCCNLFRMICTWLAFCNEINNHFISVGQIYLVMTIAAVYIASHCR